MSASRPVRGCAVELTEPQAREIIQKLGLGIPPRAEYVELISSGGDEFFAKVRQRFLRDESTAGDVRFVVGSWGSGKTHFLRRLKQAAFEEGYLVSTVELSSQDTPFNKFERVVYAIVREISAPNVGAEQAVAPIGRVLKNALGDDAKQREQVFRDLRTQLDADDTIDPDVKRLVRAFWQTFVTDDDVSDESVDLAEQREFLLQWFAGDTDKRRMRSEFGIQHQLTKENARRMLGSIVALARLLGYRGLVVLLDESEMSTSIMSRSNRQDAHNNLLHLINEIDQIAGLRFVYAAVPEFWIDERYGITTYGALSQRIGKMPDHAPRALDTTWNIESLSTDSTVYLETAGKIRDLYETAFPGEYGDVLDATDLRQRINYSLETHGQHRSLSIWRVVVRQTVELCNLGVEGLTLPSLEDDYKATVRFLERADEE